MQIIFQDPYSSLNPRMTVGQDHRARVWSRTSSSSAAHEVCRSTYPQTMEECGLQDYMLHRYPHQFSGGQRQRICIARALAVKPKFVVCDECVSALDVSIQSQIINLLQELKEQRGPDLPVHLPRSVGRSLHFRPYRRYVSGQHGGDRARLTSCSTIPGIRTPWRCFPPSPRRTPTA